MGDLEGKGEDKGVGSFYGPMNDENLTSSVVCPRLPQRNLIHEFAIGNILAVLDEVNESLPVIFLVLKAPKPRNASPIMLAASQCLL